MKLKRMPSVAIVLFMLLALLFGCQTPPIEHQQPIESPSAPPLSETQPPTPQPSPPPVDAPQTVETIKVSLWTTQQEFLNTIAAFEDKFPNIKVEIIETTPDEYNDKVSIMLSGNSDLDVIGIKESHTVYPLASKGQLADLSSFVSRDGVDMAGYSGLADYFNINGKQLAIPFSANYYLLYYNKDIFDAAGVQYPANDWTWEQFEDMAKSLTFGNGADKIYGAHLHTWHACVENWAVAEGKDTLMSTDYSFFRPYYEMALRMQNEDKTIMDFATLKTGHISYNSVFFRGQVAMVPMGNWFTSANITVNKAGESRAPNWGIATLPHANGIPAGFTVGSTSAFAINAATAKTEAAWEFVKFFTGSEGSNIYTQSGGFPALLNDTTLGMISSVEGMPDGAFEALQVRNISLDRPIEDKVTEVNNMLGEIHELMMLGEITIDDGLFIMATESKRIQGK